MAHIAFLVDNYFEQVELTGPRERLKDDLQNAGAIYLDQAVCIDHYLITSRCPDDIAAFAEAIHHMLTDAAPVKPV